jgi:hypothetical protein
LCVLVLFVARAGSDVGSNAPAATEPVTGEAAVNAPGSETTFRPFQPYGIGEDAGVPYEALSADEQAAADRNRSTDGWDGIHASYNTGVVQLAQQAAAASAATQLGVEGLSTTGVVP